MDMIMVGLIIAMAVVYIIKRIHTIATKPRCSNCDRGCEGCKIHGEKIVLK